LQLPCASRPKHPGPEASAPTSTVALTRRPAALAAPSCPLPLPGYFSPDLSKFWVADAKNPLTRAVHSHLPCSAPGHGAIAARPQHIYAYPAVIAPTTHHTRNTFTPTLQQRIASTVLAPRSPSHSPLSLHLPCSWTYTQPQSARQAVTKSFTLTRHHAAHRQETNSRPTNSPYAARPCRKLFVGEIEAKDGLPSADRNNKATLLLTGPFRTAKSSAKDLTPLVLKLQYAKYRDALPAPRRSRLLRR
jgi:hypothetical protein